MGVKYRAMLGSPSNRYRFWRAAAAVLLALGAVPAFAQNQAPATNGAAAVAAAPADKARAWLGPDKRPLPFASDEDVLEFLRTARVVSIEQVPVGITAPQKVTLEKDGVRAHAHFSSIDEDKALVTLRDGKREMGFRDSHRFNCAAYGLARLLGLDNVPPAALRTVSGKRGTLSLWIEDSFTEKDRIKQNIQLARPQEWVRQKLNMQVFDALIYNTDRNQGNILIDSNWKIWMIDHTRAFRRQNTLQDPERITGAGRKLLARLRAVTDKEIQESVKPHLTGMETEAILKRRVKLVSLIDKLVAEKGENAVLFTED